MAMGATTGARWARWVAWLGGLMLAMMAARGAWAQTSVVMRATGAVGDAARGIVLSDVAEIDPPTTDEAERLADIVVAPSARGGVDVTVAQVRAAMDVARVNWGRVTLRGAVCRVAGEAAAKKETPRAGARAVGAAPTPQTVDVRSATIKGAVSQRLLSLYAVDEQDLRLGFEAGDEEFLAQEIGDRRVDVQPAAGGTSARAPVNVYIYEGDRLVGTRLVSAQALINRSVVTAREPILRGQVVGGDVVEVGRQWMQPNARPPASPDAVVGQIAARLIAAGTVVSAADVAPAVACKRGDIVWVDALSGSVTVRAKARAQGTGKVGEMVVMKLDGSDRTFSARMAGVGRAVMVVGGGSDEVAK